VKCKRPPAYIIRNQLVAESICSLGFLYRDIESSICATSFTKSAVMGWAVQLGPTFRKELARLHFLACPAKWNHQGVTRLHSLGTLKPDILYSALCNRHNPIQQSASYDNYKYLYKIVKKSISTTLIPIDQHTNTEARHEIKIHILSFMEARHDL
jgi:hypothetical protein